MDHLIIKLFSSLVFIASNEETHVLLISSTRQLHSLPLQFPTVIQVKLRFHDTGIKKSLFHTHKKKWNFKLAVCDRHLFTNLSPSLSSGWLACRIRQLNASIDLTVPYPIAFAANYLLGQMDPQIPIISH